jgi:hypothetical protein
VPENVKPEQLDAEIAKARQELVQLQERIRQMVQRREQVAKTTSNKLQDDKQRGRD